MDKKIQFFDKSSWSYILLIGIGYFWSGSMALSMESDLAGRLDNSSMITNGFGSLARLAGMLVFMLLCKYKRDAKKVWIVFMSCSIMLGGVFWISSSVTVKVTAQILNLLCGAGGYGAAYHFAAMNAGTGREHPGKKFAIGYVIGAVGTFLLTLVPNLDLFSTAYSMLVYVPCILMNIYVVVKLPFPLDMEERENRAGWEKEPDSLHRDELVRKMAVLAVMIFIMGILSSYASASLEILMQGRDRNTVMDRMFITIGLILAGILVDKNRHLFDMVMVLMMVLPLITCIFVKEGSSVDMMYSMHYILSGFLTVFVTVSFMEFGQERREYLALSAMGYGIVRLTDFMMFFIVKYLLSEYLITVLTLIVFFICLLTYFYCRYDNHGNTVHTDGKVEMFSREQYMAKFCMDYGITPREKEVLGLLLEGKSGKEIAAELFITTGTVKNTLTRIYKKSGMSKNELIQNFEIAADEKNGIPCKYGISDLLVTPVLLTENKIFDRIAVSSEQSEFNIILFFEEEYL